MLLSVSDMQTTQTPSPSTRKFSLLGKNPCCVVFSLYFHLITSKFIYFQLEARCSWHLEWENHSANPFCHAQTPWHPHRENWYHTKKQTNCGIILWEVLPIHTGANHQLTCEHIPGNNWLCWEHSVWKCSTRHKKWPVVEGSGLKTDWLQYVQHTKWSSLG